MVYISNILAACILERAVMTNLQPRSLHSIEEEYTNQIDNQAALVSFQKAVIRRRGGYIFPRALHLFQSYAYSA